MKTSAFWLFTFTSYTYCQGTRDANYYDMRLLKFTLPCEEDEARICLVTRLRQSNIEFDLPSAQSLTELIINI